MTTTLLAQASPSSSAHAVRAGEVETLCGVVAEGITERAFPGGATRVCRACTHAAAVADSTVPLGRFGKKRPGGM
jgi:hypothetical protein